jgi:uncharacterized protein YjbJ (UPF0337 family)
MASMQAIQCATTPELSAPVDVAERTTKFPGDAHMVNKDQVGGVAKQAKGAVKDAAGKAIGNQQMQAEGKADKVAGKVQKSYGDMKEKIKHVL